MKRKNMPDCKDETSSIPSCHLTGISLAWLSINLTLFICLPSTLWIKATLPAGLGYTTKFLSLSVSFTLTISELLTKTASPPLCALIKISPTVYGNCPVWLATLVNPGGCAQSVFVQNKMKGSKIFFMGSKFE